MLTHTRLTVSEDLTEMILSHLLFLRIVQFIFFTPNFGEIIGLFIDSDWFSHVGVT